MTRQSTLPIQSFAAELLGADPRPLNAPVDEQWHALHPMHVDLQRRLAASPKAATDCVSLPVYLAIATYAALGCWGYVLRLLL